jgi:hypothetical protein
MKMGTTASLWRYDAAPVGPLQLVSICQTAIATSTVPPVVALDNLRTSSLVFRHE